MKLTTDALIRMWFNQRNVAAITELARRGVLIGGGWATKNGIQIQERGQHGPKSPKRKDEHKQ